MEPRKLIKFGNSSYIISLPISWIKKNSLEKGSFIYIKENSNNELILTPSLISQKKEKEVYINVDGKDIETIRGEVTAAYINGYGSIIIRGNTLKQKIDSLRRLIGFLVGLSIIGWTENELVVKDVLDYSKVPPQDLIKRINSILISMFSHLKNSIEYGEFSDEYKKINELDVEINRNYILLWKLLRKEDTIFNKKELYDFWWLSMNQEYIGDEIKRISRELVKAKLNNKEQKLLLNLINTSEKVYVDAVSAFKNRNLKLAINISKKNTIIKEYEKVIKKNKNLVFKNICDRFKTISRHIYYIIKLSIY